MPQLCNGLAPEARADILRVRPQGALCTVAPITIAYRGHFRDVAPGDTCKFRLFTPHERQRDDNRPASVPRERGARHG